MVELVDDDRQDIAALLVDLVRIQPKLARDVYAARMDLDLLEALEVRDPVLDRAIPLFGGVDLESLAPHVADRFRARAVGLDRPRARLWNRVEQFGRSIDFDLVTEGLVIDVKH